MVVNINNRDISAVGFWNFPISTQVSAGGFTVKKSFVSLCLLHCFRLYIRRAKYRKSTKITDKVVIITGANTGNISVK